jgi:uncharacterized cupin superfamily protein
MLSRPELIQVGPLEVRFLMGGDQNRRGASLFEVSIPSEVHLPASRSHDKAEMTIYGLQGTTTWTVERTPTVINAGDTLCIPRGAIHRFDNDSGFLARVLIIATPGVVEAAFFRELGAAMADLAGHPEQHVQVNGILGRHGVTAAP